MRKGVLVLLLFAVCLSIEASEYWQQKVDYRIEVELDDVDHQLKGFEKIQYYNNSPDTLFEIYFHLWPNAYRNANTPLSKQLITQGNFGLYYGVKDDFGFIDSLNFLIDGELVEVENVDEHGEIIRLKLGKELLPNSSVEITTPFRVKIPSAGISRLGHDRTAYQITQWYPKPAVYDEDGWHTMSYLDQGEFYSEFGTYDVSIVLPKNYVVGATGNKTASSITEDEDFIKSKIEETKAFLQNRNYPVDSDYFPASSSNTKVLRYHQENVHDFAWFADKRWMVEEQEVEVSGRMVKMSVLFLPHNAVSWKKAMGFAKKGLRFYSDNIGAFPYQQCTVVDGDISAGQGMEYPNVTIIGDCESSIVLEQTIVHELGHNWFYGMLGSNERKHSWMDEGVNSYFELKFMQKEHANSKMSKYVGDLLGLILKEDEPNLTSYHRYAFMYAASRSLDQKTDLDASLFHGDNYATVVYAKPAFLFYYLEQYVGEEVLNKTFKKYFEQWSFKHPSPDDFKSLFERELGEDLDWFFNDLLYSNKKLDYKIKGIRSVGGSGVYEVLVENNSDIPAPFVLDLVKEDSVVSSAWYKGFAGERKLLLPAVQFDKVELDKFELTPDLNRENNVIKSSGVFKKIEPFETSFLFSSPKQDVTQMFYVPFVGYNANDKLQIGVLLYNSFLQEKRWRYLLMPSYGLGSAQLGGVYKGVYSKSFRHSFARKMNVIGLYKKTGLGRFGQIRNGFLDKLEPKVEFIGGVNSSIDQKLSFRYSRTRLKVAHLDPLINQYLTLEYKIENNEKIHPYKAKVSSQLINWERSKVWGEYTQVIRVNEEVSPIKLRLFAGAFLGKKGNDLTHRFRLTAGSGGDAVLESGGELVNRGMTDYLFDEVYLARYNSSLNFLSQQVITSDGGFRTGLFLGANNSWLTSANVTIPSPVKFLKVFGDLGFYPGVGTNVDVAYGVGVQINVISDVVELYFPIVNSENINNNYQAVGLSNYFQRVKFLFNVGQYYDAIN